jgi:hypothetical protein
MGLVKPGSLREATEDVIDAEIVSRQLAKAGKGVTEEEVETWALGMQAKYTPPFDWRMICQYKQTTPDQERERWRRIQAWKRITGTDTTPEVLKAFIAENEDHFAAATATRSHPDRDARPGHRHAGDCEQEAPGEAETSPRSWMKASTSAGSPSTIPTTRPGQGQGRAQHPVKKLGGGSTPFAAARGSGGRRDRSRSRQVRVPYHQVRQGRRGTRARRTSRSRAIAVDRR